MKKTILLLSSFLIVSTATLAQNTAKAKEVLPKKTEVMETAPEVVFDSIHFQKSAEMLDETIYWELIDKTVKANLSQEDQELFLTNELEKLSPKEIIGFRLRTDKLLFDSYTSDLWCAAYIMNGGTTDGGFDYFRCWIISKGKEAYYNALANPDSLINLVKDGQNAYEFEGFWFVAMNAFLNKTDHEIYNFIDYDTFVTNDEHYPLLTFNWNVDEPKTMSKICPVLFQKLWKN
ncbi:DUF4240 domain-containing protein [Flavobacterium sp. UMI-01]|uniref:DUF4240 domain-containing protein n=1 Tax=Flavobacterium sp. UMI-01 TaxID=1441053 RepID=UPI001C7CF4E6|nr:DUF4240 domain-containing protein [Flavobacterium sp. UMI-01]GIZ08218.1 hypothetical protein FUMI01_09450 [Flavobacterium sp. UMI-01]